MNVLVVEDEPAVQDLIAVNLEHVGHRVLRARDAESALRIVKGELPDLLVIDWMLPGMSGVALAKALRGDERSRQVPIILLTARGEEADKVAGLEAGADDYVTKPFDCDELEAKVRVFLRLQRAEELSKLKSDALQLIAHETRTPMTGTTEAGLPMKCGTPTSIRRRLLSHVALQRLFPKRIGDSLQQDAVDLSQRSMNIQQMFQYFRTPHCIKLIGLKRDFILQRTNLKMDVLRKFPCRANGRGRDIETHYFVPQTSDKTTIIPFTTPRI